jgi:hypothetical protein
MECSQDPALSERVKINEKISAADQVQSRERWITQYVLPREQTQIANLLRNAVLAVFFHEEALDAFCRGLRSVDWRCTPRCGRLQRRIIDIGPK